MNRANSSFLVVALAGMLLAASIGSSAAHAHGHERRMNEVDNVNEGCACETAADGGCKCGGKCSDDNVVAGRQRPRRTSVVDMLLNDPWTDALDIGRLWDLTPRFGFPRGAFSAGRFDRASGELTMKTLVSDAEKTVVAVNLAGIPRDDIKVSVDSQGILSVDAQYPKPSDEATDESFHYFAQRSLPFGVDASKITVDYTDGLLKVTIPKPSKDGVTDISFA